MAINAPKHILIAPLDWGLGHTTRCVPIIRYIQECGHVPIVAGNASQLSFVKEIFEGIATLPLEGYNVRYSKWNKWGQMGLLSQLPGISATIKAEHEWLLKIAGGRQIDGIISDNRYGLYHPGIPSVILTHQLEVQTGFGQAANRIVQSMHYKYLERFNATWIVDAPGEPNLSGKLAHTQPLPKAAKYIGLLSRFEELTVNDKQEGGLLVLLSGPEPQRSEIAAVLWQQIQDYQGSVTFVAGSEQTVAPGHIPAHITYYKRLTDNYLAPILRAAKIVICRSGYSTLMDIARLNKKAILIPTPGQTEQQYLAQHLHQAGIFYHADQKGFTLREAMDKAATFPFKAAGLNSCYHLYEAVLQKWLTAL